MKLIQCSGLIWIYGQLGKVEVGSVCHENDSV